MTRPEDRAPALVEHPIDPAPATVNALAELAFLRERVLRSDSSWVGASSTAMLGAALEQREYVGRLPMDEGDLARCEETFRRAPAHLQERMKPMMNLARRAVREGGLYCQGCDTFGHSTTMGDYCEKCHPEEFAEHRRKMDAVFAEMRAERNRR